MRLVSFRLALIVFLTAAGCQAAANNLSDDFYTAIRNNDLVRLKAVVHGATEANTKDGHGETPLMYAAFTGSLDAMRFLIERGADVNTQNEFGSTALIWSATDAAKVRLLVEHGANVNLATKKGRTALLVAAMSDRSAAIVRFLLDKGADLKAVDYLKTTPLRAATLGNDTETIRLLIDAGVDVNAADLPGITPLMMAAGWNGNLRAIDMLLAKGANVNAISRPVMGLPAKNGASEFGSLTALTMSAAFGPSDLISTLLTAGADVNAKDVRGMTPLMLAAANDHQNPAVIRMLLEHGADASVKSKPGDTAADWARRTGLPAGIQLLKVYFGAGSRREPTVSGSGALTLRRTDSGAHREIQLGLLRRERMRFLPRAKHDGLGRRACTVEGVRRRRKGRGGAGEDAEGRLSAGAAAGTHRCSWRHGATGLSPHGAGRERLPGRSSYGRHGGEYRCIPIRKRIVACGCGGPASGRGR